MEVQLQGLGSLGFQSRNGNGDEEEEVGKVESHERRARDSLLVALTSKSGSRNRAIANPSLVKVFLSLQSLLLLLRGVAVFWGCSLDMAPNPRRALHRVSPSKSPPLLLLTTIFTLHISFPLFTKQLVFGSRHAHDARTGTISLSAISY
ncbi:hypothetical protein AMTRI_Chr07g78200 [Amborella trichopoda]